MGKKKRKKEKDNLQMKSLEHLFPDEHSGSHHEEVMTLKKKITDVIEYKNNLSKSLHVTVWVISNSSCHRQQENKKQYIYYYNTLLRVRTSLEELPKWCLAW